jgi:hypothetical protein
VIFSSKAGPGRPIDVVGCGNAGFQLSQLTRSFDYGRPNSTLEPEWDVLHKIKWTLSQQLTGATIIHTKGHQDDDRKI